jgi:hypothetical protein
MGYVGWIIRTGQGLLHARAQEKEKWLGIERLAALGSQNISIAFERDPHQLAPRANFRFGK